MHDVCVVALLCCCVALAACAKTSGPRVAVVGGGIGGCATAYYTHENLPDASLTLFEKRGEICGRLHTHDFVFGNETHRIDMGAGIYHPLNKHFEALLRAVGVKDAVRPPHAGHFGVWDGDTMVYEKDEHKYLSLARMFWRYGLDPLRVNWLVDAFKPKWSRIYDFPGAYTSVEDLFKFSSLYDYTQMTFDEFMTQQRVSGETQLSDRFIFEMVAPVVKTMYQGTTSTHTAWSVLVSLIGAFGGVEVEGGMQDVVERVCKASAAVIHLDTTVTDITKNAADNTYSITYTDSDGKVQTQGPFDYVSIAAPLELAHMHFVGFGKAVEDAVSTGRHYQMCYATTLMGKIRPGYFHRSSNPPEIVATTESEKIPFTVVSWAARLANGTDLYEMSSREQPSQRTLEQLFENPVVLYQIPWRAYPVMEPLARWPPVLLDEGVFYNNAIESAVSVIETAVLAARNTALLVNSAWSGMQHLHHVAPTPMLAEPKPVQTMQPQHKPVPEQQHDHPMPEPQKEQSVAEQQHDHPMPEPKPAPEHVPEPQHKPSEEPPTKPWQEPTMTLAHEPESEPQHEQRAPAPEPQAEL
eukprot:TRINITY_DN369_c1_g1_i1.p1 TRINITY_DN369_c1_g1~~TRINITY_DN369_c1_g1_i1.p1  ORF type:complete len:590 (+),score=131.63 TRINITY_DN369_c1_g1_i1:28-1770(+)